MKKYYVSVAIVTTVLMAGGLLIACDQTANATEVTVYKSPTCGCCKDWIKHMKENGFSVKAIDVADVGPYRAKYGVSPSLTSCHTAVIEGYAIEGHVPAADIRRLLKERPNVQGLAVPGMPSGAPGMEQGYKDRYDVLTFDKYGRTSVYAQY